jgi:hypothetical protein
MSHSSVYCLTKIWIETLLHYGRHNGSGIADVTVFENRQPVTEAKFIN